MENIMKDTCQCNNHPTHDANQNPMAIIHEIDRLAHEKIKTFAEEFEKEIKKLALADRKVDGTDRIASRCRVVFV